MPTLVQAIATIKAGRRAEGRKMLEQILATEPQNIMALLWTIEVTDAANEQREYLNRILAIDPTNVAARERLTALNLPSAQNISTVRQTEVAPSTVEPQASSAPAIPPTAHESMRTPAFAQSIADQEKEIVRLENRRATLEREIRMKHISSLAWGMTLLLCILLDPLIRMAFAAINYVSGYYIAGYNAPGFPVFIGAFALIMCLANRAGVERARKEVESLNATIAEGRGKLAYSRALTA
jgi:predicted anti-sigma-YlaC factor YlaD